MDFYAGKMSLLNDIAQIETMLGDPGARPRRPLPDPKDTHRSTHTQMALFGPTIAWYEAYNPAIAQVKAAAFGIRARKFDATPSYGACRYCAYNQVCPFTATRS